MSIGTGFSSQFIPITTRLPTKMSIKPEILALNTYCQGKYYRTFGFGGMLDNDCGYAPFNWVIKNVAVRVIGTDTWLDSVKISDDPKKAIGNPAAIAKVLSGIETWKNAQT